MGLTGTRIVNVPLPKPFIYFKKRKGRRKTMGPQKKTIVKGKSSGSFKTIDTHTPLGVQFPHRPVS